MAELTIAKSLNKAYRQVPVDRHVFDIFKTQLSNYYKQISAIDTEEKLKGDLMDFLKFTFYSQNYKVSPNGDIDCAIHLGANVTDPVGVIIEVKKPTNITEMITREDLNRKALQELLLYYLRERHTKKNIQLKQLIITNVYEYFVFDAHEFERIFYSNKKLIKRFEEFNDGALTSEKPISSTRKSPPDSSPMYWTRLLTHGSTSANTNTSSTLATTSESSNSSNFSAQNIC